MERKEQFFRTIIGEGGRRFLRKDMGYKGVHICNMDELTANGIAPLQDKFMQNGFVVFYVRDKGGHWDAIEEKTGTSVCVGQELKTYKEAYKYVENMKLAIMKCLSSIDNEQQKTIYKGAYCGYLLIKKQHGQI